MQRGVWRHPLDQRRLGAQCPRHGRGHAGAVPYSTGRSGHGGSAALRGAGAGGEPGSASLGARPSGAQGAGGEPGCAALRGAGAGGGEPNGGVPLARTRARRSRALHNVCAQRAAANRTAGCPRHGRGHAGAGPYITSARAGGSAGLVHSDRFPLNACPPALTGIPGYRTIHSPLMVAFCCAIAAYGIRMYPDAPVLMIDEVAHAHDGCVLYTLTLAHPSYLVPRHQRPA